MATWRVFILRFAAGHAQQDFTARSRPSIRSHAPPGIGAMGGISYRALRAGTAARRSLDLPNVLENAWKGITVLQARRRRRRLRVREAHTEIAAAWDPHRIQESAVLDSTALWDPRRRRQSPVEAAPTFSARLAARRPWSCLLDTTVKEVTSMVPRGSTRPSAPKVATASKVCGGTVQLGDMATKCESPSIRV